jgi:hypothetical protein
MNRATLLFGHADHDTFNDRLAKAYARGYARAGGEVERIDLAALDFGQSLRGLGGQLRRRRQAADGLQHGGLQQFVAQARRVLRPALLGHPLEEPRGI